VNFNNAGEDGISFDGGGDRVQIEDCVLNHINQNAVYINNYTNFLFRNNLVKNVGCVPGLGNSSENQYIGVTYACTKGGAIIENNRIDSIGYIGINFRASNITVRRNVISNYDVIKNDGGGIHTWNGRNENIRRNQNIDSNIVIHSIASTLGTNSKFKGGMGIYMDDCSVNATVDGNTIINCNGGGIYLHGTNYIKVINNICYKNSTGFFMADATSCDGSGNVIERNIFFAGNDQLPTEFKLYKFHFVNWFMNKIKVQTTYDAFENTTWQNNLTLKSQGNELFKYNDSNKPLVINLPGNYKNLSDNKTYKTITLKPYTSCILTKL
jgi:parallel beta-helix repeat protein